MNDMKIKIEIEVTPGEFQKKLFEDHRKVSNELDLLSAVLQNDLYRGLVNNDLNLKDLNKLVMNYKDQSKKIFAMLESNNNSFLDFCQKLQNQFKPTERSV